ncbi:MAG: DEAD/DEAH box helicase [Patescibacteria group bacterium]|nr:DEAD/DEAH box helicase [Patescibacteria group bacterium]
MTQITFGSLGIAPKILKILDRLHFKTPTPIQHQSIPTVLKGKDIMGIAQTGTGKTLAFGVPMVQKLLISGGNGLVVLPTRELALQVDETINKIGKSLNIRTAVLIGGQNINRQINLLRSKPDIIIVTPGRLVDHLERKTINLSKTSILVLDEADRMLDMGFAPQIKKILSNVPRERQTMLFSATMPSNIIQIAKTYMKLPVRIEVAPSGSAAENVTHEIFIVKRESKMALLESIIGEQKGSTLIFSRTKFGAKKIAYAIRKMGHTSSEIHSDRSLNQRLKALSGFKKGVYQFLVATDVAARGIDVNNIELIINFDMPDNAEDYVHRIGRTGRAGHSGHAISFAMPNQRYDIKTIERLIKKQLPISNLPNLPKSEQRQNFSYKANNSQGKRNYSSRNKNNKRFRTRSSNNSASQRKRSGFKHKKW